MKRLITVLAFLLSFAIAVSAQSTIQVSNLPTNTTLSGGDLLLITKASGSSRSRKMTIDSFEANFHDKGGAVFDAAGYVNLATAIAAAIAAGKPNVIIPAGTYHLTSHIVLGDGTSTTNSTIQGITLIGVGGGMKLRASPDDATAGAVNIIADSAMDEMILVNGPIAGVRIENINLLCNANAQTGIRAIHTQRGIFRNIEISENLGPGFVLTGYGSHDQSIEGTAGVLMEHVHINTHQANSAGFDIGTSTYTNQDVAQLNATNLSAQFGGSGTTGSKGFVLRGLDHANFYYCYTFQPATALVIIPPTGGTMFPDSINFYGANLAGTSNFSVSGTWTGGSLKFDPFHTEDGEVWPNDSRFYGIESGQIRKYHGAFTWPDVQTFQSAPLDTIDSAATNTPVITHEFRASSTGTVAAGFGARLRFAAEDSTTQNADVAAIDAVYPVDVTHATRDGAISLHTALNGTLTETARFDYANGSQILGNGRTILNRILAASPAGITSGGELRTSGFNGANGDAVSFLFGVPDSAGTNQFVGRLVGYIENATAGSVKGGMEVLVRADNADTLASTRVASRWAASGIFNTYPGAPVASGSAIVPTGNVFHVTGANEITSIDATGIIGGTTIVIIFDSTAQLTDGNNLKLAGNFTGNADRTITLVFDGTNFYETARSSN